MSSAEFRDEFELIHCQVSVQSAEGVDLLNPIQLPLVASRVGYRESRFPNSRCDHSLVFDTI